MGTVNNNSYPRGGNNLRLRDNQFAFNSHNFYSYDRSEKKSII